MHRSYLYPHNPIFCALPIGKGAFFMLMRKKRRNRRDKNKTEVTLGFCVYLRRREPFLRSVA